MDKAKLQVHFLNHSSVLFESAEHALLCDPWLTGHAFSGGWALEWDNQAALETAARADAVWISHPHSDHMHFETLKQLCAKNPRLKMLANRNPQIDLTQILKSLPFGEVVPLPERKLVEVAPHTFVFVLPSLAIDAVLAYQSGDFFLLNVNDAILDASSARAILDGCDAFAGKHPDALLINFSHANRIPEQNADRLAQYYKDRLRSYVEVFRPRACLPIASFQVYTGEFARWQNDVRVLPDDLRGIDPCVRSFLPGFTAEITRDSVEVIERRVRPTEQKPRSYDDVPSLDELRRAFAEYTARLRAAFFGVALPRPLHVRFPELSSTFRLDFKAGTLTETHAAWHLECYARPFHAMITKPFGFDGFYVNADYRVGNGASAEDQVADFIFKGCLLDYQITPKTVLQSVFRKEQWTYLLNRREQVWHIVSRGHTFGGVR